MTKLFKITIRGDNYHHFAKISRFLLLRFMIVFILALGTLLRTAPYGNICLSSNSKKVVPETGAQA